MSGLLGRALNSGLSQKDVAELCRLGAPPGLAGSTQEAQSAWSSPPRVEGVGGSCSRFSRTKGLRGAGLRGWTPPTHPTLLSQCPGRDSPCLADHTRRPSTERILSLVLEEPRWPPSALRTKSARAAPPCVGGLGASRRPWEPLLPSPSRSILAAARSAGACRGSGARRPWEGRQSTVSGVSGRVRGSAAPAPRLRA